MIIRLGNPANAPKSVPKPHHLRKGLFMSYVKAFTIAIVFHTNLYIAGGSKQ